METVVINQRDIIYTPMDIADIGTRYGVQAQQ